MNDTGFAVEAFCAHLGACFCVAFTGVYTLPTLNSPYFYYVPRTICFTNFRFCIILSPKNEAATMNSFVGLFASITKSPRFCKSGSGRCRCKCECPKSIVGMHYHRYSGKFTYLQVLSRNLSSRKMLRFRSHAFSTEVLSRNLISSKQRNCLSRICAVHK